MQLSAYAYWLPTHNHLVMVVVALCCTRQSRAPNIDRCAPEIWPWPQTLTLTFDLDPDLWPWPQIKVIGDKQWNKNTSIQCLTLTYIARLAKVKVDLHAQDEGRRSNGSARRVVTDGQADGQTGGQTDGRYQVHYLPRFAVDNYIKECKVDLQKFRPWLFSIAHMCDMRCQ